MAIDLGDVVALTVETRDSAGALADAGSVVLSIQLPDGTAVTPAITHTPNSGIYQVDYVTTMAGPHRVRWTASGVNTSAYADVFNVSGTFPRYLPSLAATKEQLKITGTADDEKIRGFMESATEVVERHTGMALVRRTETEDHKLSWSPTLILKRSPAVSLTSVVRVDGTITWNVNDLYLSKTSGIVTIKSPAMLFNGHIEVIYVVGMTTIPQNFVDASSMIVEHLWQTRRGVRGSARVGGTEDTVTIPGMGFAIPRPALELLGKPPPLVA